MLGRDRAGGGGADIGEIAIVEQQRLDQPGRGADSSTIMPLTLGRPSFGLSKKPGLILMAKPSMPGT